MVACGRGIVSTRSNAAPAEKEGMTYFTGDQIESDLTVRPRDVQRVDSDITRRVSVHRKVAHKRQTDPFHNVTIGQRA